MLARPIGVDAPPLSFATIDFVNVILFCAIGLYYDRRWAIWVGGFHIGMLLTHLSYVITPLYNQLVYLSILAILSYASLAMIMIPPVWNRIFGYESRDMDYSEHVNLGYWHPLFCHRRYDSDASE